VLDVRYEQTLSSRCRSRLPSGKAPCWTKPGVMLSVRAELDPLQQQRIDGGERGFSRSERR